MPKFAISRSEPSLLRVLLLLFLLSPSASEELWSRCALPREFSEYFAPTVRDLLCTCESDWTDAFCARLSAYERMSPEKGPSVCVCRQKFGTGGCVQFLTRCFRRPVHGTAHVQHRLRRELCACCFNQPDPFCTQLDCAQMRPQFDVHANTSCHCHLPTNNRDGIYAPSALCRQQSQLFTREVPSLEEDFGTKNDEMGVPAAGSSRGSSSFRPSFGTLFPSIASPIIRFFALFLLVLVIISLLAVAVFFWNRWRPIRLRRKGRTEDRERRTTEGEEEEKRRPRRQEQRRHMANNGGTLEEATV